MMPSPFSPCPGWVWGLTDLPLSIQNYMSVTPEDEDPDPEQSLFRQGYSPVCNADCIATLFL